MLSFLSHFWSTLFLKFSLLNMIFFQISCAHKDNWSIKKLLIMCVQEDERLRHGNQMVTHVKRKDLDRQSCPIVNV
jgi:hypothetical protein